MESKLTPQQLEQVAILLDPVKFAKSHFNWEARWYQAEILNGTHTHRRIVTRCGRRVGKCLNGDSEILTENGPIKIRELYNMNTLPQVATFDTKSQAIKLTPFYDVQSNGVKPVYKVQTKTGRVNYATGNHPYLILDENGKLNWIEIDNMLPGDKIAVPKSYSGLIEGKPVGVKLSRLLGYLTGDGGTSSTSTVKFTNFDDLIVNDIKTIALEYGCLVKEEKPGNYYITGTKWHENKVLDISREHGLQGKLAIEKEIPQAIMAGTEEDIVNFLGAYWDCDGWLSIQSKNYDSSHKVLKSEIGICSSSEKLARGVQHLLLRLGISSLLKQKKVKYKEETRIAWQVTIQDSSNQLTFINKIPLLAKDYKKKQLLNLIQQRNCTDNRSIDSIPKEIFGYVKNRQAELGLNNMQVCGANSRSEGARLRTCYNVSRSKLKEYAKNLNDSYLDKLASNDILWDEVISIEYIGEQETYDLTVPETSTLIADDIISHNTETMCVHMLWYSFTHENSVCLIAAPYENQIKLVFRKLREFIGKSDVIKAAIQSNTKNPEFIQFKNGSIIQGFTAGTRGGNEGASIRGQRADWIYLDKHAS